MANNKKWLVFIGAALAVMMVDVDITAVNLAITDMTKDLHLTISGGQWIVNGYTMAAACLMAFAGRLGDSYGHKFVFLCGLVVFAFASLAVALSVGFWSISVARIIQGACIAFTFPMASVFVRETFPDNQKGLAVSLLISIAGTSQAIGPTFGGLMIYYFSWHWIFIINLPLAVLCFYLIGVYLKEPKPDVALHFDVSALLSLIVGLFAIMSALNEVNRFGLISFSFVGLIVLGIIALSVFFICEWRDDYPLLGLKALLNAAFTTAIGTRLIVTFNYFCWLFGLGLLLQKGLHYDAFFSGLIMMSLTATIVVFSVPVGKWIDRAGFKPPQITGFMLMFVACVLLSSTEIFGQLMFLLLSLFIGGLSTALLIPATTAGSLSYVKPNVMGLAMGVLFTCGFLGNSMGVAIAGSIIDEHTIKAGFCYVMWLAALLSLLGLIISLSLKTLAHPAKET